MGLREAAGSRAIHLVVRAFIRAAAFDEAGVRG
ncbi:MAG: hypothetical protein JWO64_1151, partial [Hyphomicrobiales bacterium]|nr:hypothetical protein [Hyphomicrobiales bacterium]